MTANSSGSFCPSTSCTVQNDSFYQTPIPHILIVQWMLQQCNGRFIQCRRKVYCFGQPGQVLRCSSPVCSPVLSTNAEVTAAGGAKYRWGIKNSRFSTNKSLYFANDTKYRHSYYGKRIGTRMRSIKWCHFQWPWTNPNPVFKVTPLFDDKYLTNGYRYGHS